MQCLSNHELCCFAEGQLSAEAAHAVEEHVSQCATCLESLNTLTRDAEFEEWLQQRRPLESAIESSSSPTSDRQFLHELNPLYDFDPHSATTLGGREVSERSSIPPTLPSVPHLEVRRLLGEGGMGVVYDAFDPQLRRRVALKMLRREQAPEEWLERIRVEAEAAARLNHPHVVQIYAVGDSGGRPYVVLEYVGGGTLADRLGGQPQDPREAAALAAKLARTIAYAHQRHVIHRDLKPRNILLAERELGAGDVPLSNLVPKITDFGLAKLLDSNIDWTHSGQIMGTPAYAAPEQLSATFGEIGPPSDVYALGAILYEMLTGRPPLQAADVWHTIQLVLKTDPVSPRDLQPGIPVDLETICLQCLAKEPARRYSDATALASDLESFLADRPIQARPITAFERLVRWSRRNRAIAAALTALGLLLTMGALSSTIAAGHFRRLSNQLNDTVNDLTVRTDELTTARNKARQNAAENLRLARDAEAARKTAEESRQTAEDERLAAERARYVAESKTYAARIALADRAWETPDVKATIQLLEKCKPEPDQTDHRGWECNYLNRLCRSELLRITPSGIHPTPNLFGVAYSPDGRWLATGSWTFHRTTEPVVAIWDTTDYHFVRSMEAPAAEPRGLRFSRDGRRIAVLGSKSELLHVTHVDPEDKADQSTGPTDPHDFEPIGPIVAELPLFPEFEPNVTLKDARTGETIRKLIHLGGLRAADVCRDGQLAATAGEDMMVRVWNVQDGTPHQILRGHTNSASGVAFHPQLAQLASIGMDGDILIWDLTRPQRQLPVHVPSTHSHGEWLTGFAFSANSDELFGIECGSHPFVWARARIATGEVLEMRRFEAFRMKYRPQPALSVSGTLKRFVAPLANSDTMLGIANFDGRIRATLSYPFGPVFATAISADGRRVAAAGTSMTPVRIWDGETGEHLRDLPARAEGDPAAQTPAPPALVFNKTGEQIAAGFSNPLGVQVWEVASGRRLHRFESVSAIVVSALDFRADSRQLAAIDNHTSKIYLFDLETGKRQHLLAGPGGANSLEFHPEQPRLAVAGAQGSVYLWDADTGELVLNLVRSEASRGSYGYRPQVHWSPDGKSLAANNWKGRIDVWQTPDLESTGDERLAIAETRSMLARIRQASSTKDAKFGRSCADAIADVTLTSPVTRAERGLMWSFYEEWERAAADLYPPDETPNEYWKINAERSAANKRLVEQLIQRRPQVAELRHIQARYALRDGNIESAREHAQQAISIYRETLEKNPELTFVQRHLADALFAAYPTVWQSLEVNDARSNAGAKLERLDDGSVFASGVDAPGDTYVVTVSGPLARISTLRLEMLPDDRLPTKGPGRHPSGNFQLASIRMHQTAPDGGKGVELPFRDAWASFSWSAKNIDVQGVIRDDSPTVWHVWGRFGERHEALFQLDSPVVLEPNACLVIVLKSFADIPVNLGRFRLSATEDSEAISKRRHEPLLTSENVAVSTCLAAAWSSVGAPKEVLATLEGSEPASHPADELLRLLLKARAHRQLEQNEAAKECYRRLLGGLLDGELPARYQGLTGEVVRDEAREFIR